MPIIKVFKEDKFSQISNDLLNDSSLSLRAKGLLCYLISKPVTWTVNVAHLYKVCKEGKDAIYATINELIEAKYIVRVRTKDDKGKHIGVDYYVYEYPQRENPDVESPVLEKPGISNTESSINKEGSKGPDKSGFNPPIKKEVQTLYQRKIMFLKLVIDWIAENDTKYPKLMYVDFANYWVEQSVSTKVKLRFEEQRFFDIGRRLGTWFKKVKQEDLQAYWQKEKELPTVNDLFKTQILKVNAKEINKEATS